ncbi:MAG: hypothetical protein IJJ90_06310 [Prevotella sp.]|nr:hypothetical protein [Prevotella sp.]
MKRPYITPSVRLMPMPAAQIMAASGERVEVEIAPGEYSGEFHAPHIKSVWEE